MICYKVTSIFSTRKVKYLEESGSDVVKTATSCGKIKTEKGSKRIGKDKKNQKRIRKDKNGPGRIKRIKRIRKDEKDQERIKNDWKG